MFGCRTEALSMGIDPIQNPVNRLGTRWVMNHALDFLSVRDEESRQALTDAGIRPPILIQPDPVFELKGSDVSAQKNGIAFVLSPMKERPQWSGEIAELCDRLSERLNVPIDLLVFFPDEDASFVRDIARQSKGVRHVRFWGNPKDLLSWISSYQLLVATRFHALVLAAMSGVPFVGLGHQNKVIALCKKEGMPYWNSAEEWCLERQLARLLPLYQTPKKSVILETRIG
jgi:polysaccharide pyruvyl transferase WcaK-like protein